MSLHFVIPEQFSGELAVLQSRKVGVNYPYWLGGRFNWVAQSYLVLREWLEGLTVSTLPKVQRINFAHCMGWRALGRRQGEYRVSVRADYPRLFDVDFEILQNPLSPAHSNQAYLPYWPVPGIIPRDVERGERVTTIAYAGRVGERNLDATIRGIPDLNVVIVPPDRWHDMSRIDLLVAIRDFSGARHLNKPPSKLLNAWIANVPLIGGADSAFSAIGRPGEDYVRVHSIDEFHNALERLRTDSAFYAMIVSKGRERSNECGHEAIAREWVNVIDGPIKSDFEQWLDQGKACNRPKMPEYLDRSRNTLSKFNSRFLRKRL